MSSTSSGAAPRISGRTTAPPTLPKGTGREDPEGLPYPPDPRTAATGQDPAPLAQPISDLRCVRVLPRTAAGELSEAVRPSPSSRGMNGHNSLH